jgi:hypothetical protein
MLCAPKRSDSQNPIALDSGSVKREDGKGTGLRVRVTAEKGRILMLQSSVDCVNWVDVEVLDNAFGMSESIQAILAQNPAMFYRITFPDGPAQINDEAPASKGPFRQLGSGETLNLMPLLYHGDLSVNGNSNSISGEIVAEKPATVIAGDLIVKGNANKVSNLKVLGKVIIKGNDNELDNIEYESASEEP